MIAVVDYCKGNLRSVQRGLIDAGADAVITDDPAVIAEAEAVVLPGVGAFADAAASMEEFGQMAAVRQAIIEGKPFLGICLGENLLYEGGEEGAPDADHPIDGIGAVPGVARKLPATDGEGNLYKIPHVGWNSIEFEPGCPLLDGIEPGEYLYFTHSYVGADSPYTVATTTHSITFPCVVAPSDRVFGVQFHPEKSSDAGAKLLRNFLAIVEQVRNEDDTDDEEDIAALLGADEE